MDLDSGDWDCSSGFVIIYHHDHTSSLLRLPGTGWWIPESALQPRFKLYMSAYPLISQNGDVYIQVTTLLFQAAFCLYLLCRLYTDGAAKLSITAFI